MDGWIMHASLNTQMSWNKSSYLSLPSIKQTLDTNNAHKQYKQAIQTYKQTIHYKQEATSNNHLQNKTSPSVIVVVAIEVVFVEARQETRKSCASSTCRAFLS